MPLTFTCLDLYSPNANIYMQVFWTIIWKDRPKDRQTLLFTVTLPRMVYHGDIQVLTGGSGKIFRFLHILEFQGQKINDKKAKKIF